jgi:hypothetical protein
MEEKNIYIKWEMKEGILIQVKIGNDIFEKTTKPKIENCFGNYLEGHVECLKCRMAETCRDESPKREVHRGEIQSRKELDKKECTECHKVRPIAEFYVKKKTGRRYQKCKACCAKKSQQTLLRMYG